MTEETIMEVDYDKNLTRLYEAIGRSDWDLAIRAASDSPDEARTWVVRHSQSEDMEDEEPQIEWRFLPIHSACARNPPKAVIASLLRAYPDGAKCIDDQGMYPLHYACGNQASREVIRNLLVSYPQAAGIADPNGQYPIHYIAQWGPSESGIVDMLLVANRAVCNAEDNDGYTPLDYTHDADYPLANEVITSIQRYVPTAPATTEIPTRDLPEVSKLAEEPDVVVPTVERTTLSSSYSPVPSPAPHSEPWKQETPSDEAIKKVSRAFESSSFNMEEEKKESTPVRSVAPVQSSAPGRSLAPVRTATPVSNVTPVSAVPDAPVSAVTVSATSEPSLSAPSGKTDKTVARLRAEINKLRAERDFANAELEERIEEEKEKSADIISDLRSKLTTVNAELAILKSNESELTDRISTLESSLQEKDAEIEKIEEEKMKAMVDAEEEKAQLRAEIAELADANDAIASKTKKMDSRLDAIAHSLESIANGHERIMEANLRQEELIQISQTDRQNKLRELLAMEEAFAQDSVAAKSVDGVVMNKAYERQKREMSAIQAILDAARE